MGICPQKISAVICRGNFVTCVWRLCSFDGSVSRLALLLDERIHALVRAHEAISGHRGIPWQYPVRQGGERGDLSFDMDNLLKGLNYCPGSTRPDWLSGLMAECWYSRPSHVREVGQSWNANEWLVDKNCIHRLLDNVKRILRWQNHFRFLPVGQKRVQLPVASPHWGVPWAWAPWAWAPRCDPPHTPPSRAEHEEEEERTLYLILQPSNMWLSTR